MKITYSPSSAPGHLHLEVAGATLIINGTSFDFSGLQEGDVLPAGAVGTPFLT